MPAAWVKTEDGRYINLNRIDGIRVVLGGGVFSFNVVAYVNYDSEYGDLYILKSGFKSKEQAQKWLDKLMEKQEVLKIEKETGQCNQ
jgi:hypothetical protein